MKHALVAILLPVLLICGCATSDADKPDRSKPRAAANQIQHFYFKRRPTEKYKSLGIVTGSSRSESTRPKNKSRAMEEMHRAAVRRGANGLILLDDDSDMMMSRSDDSVHVMAEAIIVEREPPSQPEQGRQETAPPG